MATPPYIWKQLIQRIRKHMNNGFPNDSYATSDNEILLYINQANAFGLVGQVWMGAKLTGIMEVPDGYMATVLLPALAEDLVTGDWITTLPQPPIGLPLGYSINRIYSAGPGNQGNQDFFMIKANRVGRRANMPMPGGIRAWVDYTNATILRCRASDNQPLLGKPVYVQMPITRTTDITLPMNLPDDAIEGIFNSVVMQLTKRYQEPKDVINDDLPAGNNTLKS
jgi:hypothetical protein